MIGERVYHMEVQSRNDTTMILRMVEYDFVIGLAGADKENGKYHIRFPRSCVIYLRHNGITPQEEEMELEFQNGQIVSYGVPTVLVQNYSLDEIEDILERLEQVLCDEPNVYQDLVLLMQRVADYLLWQHEEFKRRLVLSWEEKCCPCRRMHGGKRASEFMRKGYNKDHNRDCRHSTRCWLKILRMQCRIST